MSTIITPSEEQINIVVNDEKISINVESGDVIVNVTENIVEVSTVNGGYPLPTTVYSVFGRTGNIIATEGDYDLGELGDVTLVSTTNGDVLTYDGTKWINKAVSGTGTVTSVDMSVPVGLQVSGNPIVTNGTLALNYAAGYSLPTTAKQTTWDAAYNDSIVSASVSGTTTKTLTLNQQDGGTITASWTDIDTNLVTSVNGYVGTVVLTTSDIAEGSRLYYTETRVSNNVDVAANTAARHSAVTIGTANGLSLASQVLSLALASASTTGALSSTDWATFNNKVPYSGATGNVTLGEYQLSAGQVAFDQSPTGTAGVGILRWNDSDGTLDLGLKGGNVTLQVGQEMVARVVNKTGADLLESGYKVVRISSAQGQRLAVQLAQANNDTNSTDTIGIVTETIANNQEGFITILGQVKEINTTGSLQGETWADGDVLYLSPTTAGNITNIKPVAPSHMVVVGYVEYAHSQHGKIYCKTQNGYELEELHNVLISSVANNEGLFYETSTSLWKNKSIATVLGYTPISLTSLSGVSPLSYDNTTGAFSISQAGVSGDGYLSSTDWNTFNNKQTAGNYITALSGEATASGPGSAAVTLSTSAVTGKILTGVNITGGSITATDSILVAFGKVQNQINGVLGGAIYQSTWNASTNSPTLTSSTGTKGYYYIVSVAGSTNLDGITDWKVGDWAIFNGATWDKVDNTDAVSSVNGFTGAVSLTTANISEVTNLYYTDVRVSANTDVAANTAARHSAVTLGTANGLSLSTQALSLALASTSATGALSSTDWNTFNLKQAALSGTGFVKISGSTISYDNSTYYLASNPNGYTTNVGTVTSVSALTLGTTGTDLSSTVATGTTTPVITLNVPTASATNRGALSSADWSTFNGKQAALSGTGFVKISGTTISYDNSTYLTTSAAASTYQTILTNPVTGTGTTNQLPKFTGASTIGDSALGDGGAIIVATNRSFQTTGNGNYLRASDYTWIGGSGGDYGSIGYNIGYTTTTNNYNYAVTDSSSMIRFSAGGFQFKTAPTGTGGNAITYTDVLTILQTGAATFTNSVLGHSLTIQNTNSGYYSSSDYLDNSGTEKLIVGYGNSGAGALASKAIIYGTSGVGLNFYTNGSTTAKMVIDTTGNVGIGTSSPSELLEIKSTSASNPNIRLYNTFNSGTSNYGLLWYRDYDSLNNAIGAYIYYNRGGGGGGDMTFGTGIVSGVSERMRITSGGNVGIGTSSPNYLLSVVKDGGGNANTGIAGSQLVLSRTTGAAENLAFRNTGASNGISGLNYAAQIIADGNNAAEIYTTAGSPLILGTSATERFRIASGGAITCTSSVTATSFFESSDSRLKTLIQDNYQTKGIALITPKLYTKNGKVELGYYAQDFVGILDSAVSKGEDDMLSLSYREVHTAKIYALEQEIKDLKAKMN
jgi:hypothetical protein